MPSFRVNRIRISAPGIVLALSYFSTFTYLAKITSFSPVYFLTPLFLAMMLIMQSMSGIVVSGAGICAICILVFSPLPALNAEKYSTFVNLVLALLSFLVFYSYLRQRIHDYFRASAAIRLSSFLILSIITLDTFWRLSHPGANTQTAQAALEADNLGFYLYKFNSIMFADSNTVALAVQCVLFLLLYMHFIDKKGRVLIIWAIVLIALTLSRAAIISTAFTLFVVRYRLYKAHRAIFVLGISSYIIFVYFFSHHGPVVHDQSLNSKFYILYRFISYFQHATWLQLAIGSGFDRSEEILHIYSHILIITLLVESGIIGAVIYFLFIAVLVRETSGRALFVVFPLLLSGMSYWFYLGSPFMFATFAILAALDKNVSQKISKSQSGKFSGSTESILLDGA